MEKEKIKFEKELRIKLIENGSHRTAINRCVDKIILNKIDGHKLETGITKSSFQGKTA